MYTSYFGLSEAPFSISPDPRFLYMSKRHREAMAHLIFGIKEGGGFVQLTGEVGTGKTTLCRCLLLQLPENVDVALIINPQINDAELLATLCDELKVEYPEDATPKVLLKILNEYLLETYAEGKRTVLVIDEAQLLTRSVLEQVRILTNLETTTQKLLQIILIGQPELSDTLNRDDLRQLSQRITARYHLEPLKLEDTKEYVKYRLAVAGCERPLFSRRALRAVYKYTGGVPRLINVICDRSLLGAYTANARKVSAPIVRNAAREVLGTSLSTKSRWSWRWAPAAAALVLAALLIGVPESREYLRGATVQTQEFIAAEVQGLTGAMGTVSSGFGQDPATVTESESMAQARVDQTLGQPAGATATDTPQQTDDVDRSDQEYGDDVRPILTIDPLDTVAVPVDMRSTDHQLPMVLASGVNDYQRAFDSLVTRWKPEKLVTNVPMDCEQIEHLGLKCLSEHGTLTRLRHYNRAALLVLEHDGNEYPVLLTRMVDGQVTVQIAKTEHTYPVAEIEKYWQGKYVLLWRPPPLEYDEISMFSKGPDVLWLRQALNRVALKQGAATLDIMSSDYDEELRERVIDFQRNHDIEASGIVGAHTLILLNTLLNESTLPLLSQAPTG